MSNLPKTQLHRLLWVIFKPVMLGFKGRSSPNQDESKDHNQDFSFVVERMTIMHVLALFMLETLKLCKVNRDQSAWDGIWVGSPPLMILADFQYGEPFRRICQFIYAHSAVKFNLALKGQQ